ncbi:MAG: ABC transporter permease [Anaerolineales bacterium]|nr:ABC transporter permease [Anaerolineales bacterium]
MNEQNEKKANGHNIHPVGTKTMRSDSPWRIALRSLVKNRVAMAGLGVLLFISILAIIAPQISPYDPDEVDILQQLTPPSKAHLLGTDLYGRDILSRIFWGGRVTLVVGLISVAIASSIGIVLGLVAGYYGGLLDTIIMRFIDILLSFPRILLALTIVGMLGPGLFNVMLAVGISSITGYARLVRGTVLSAKEQPYVEAAHVVGCPVRRILFLHLLPNVVGPVIVLATLDIAAAILAASGLSFLGMGVQPPTSEWGYMLNEGRNYLRSAPWITFFPGMAIMISVLSTNLLGDGLRDALDPQMKE